MSDETLSSAAGVLIESSISSGNIKGFGTTFAALTSGTHNFGFGVDVLKLLTTGSYNLGLGNLSLDASPQDQTVLPSATMLYQPLQLFQLFWELVLAHLPQIHLVQKI
jgi:hypothetical protein